MSTDQNNQPNVETDAPVVSIIVVSYNTKEMTLECLRSIVRETPDLTYEVLFIDNQSTDGSWEAVEEEFKNDARFTLRLSDKNLGFAGANNEMAKGARGEYILLLNPDTVVLDRAIEKLVQFAGEYPDNGIWGGRTVFADGTLNPTSCWGPYTLWSQFCAAFGLRALFPKSVLFHPRGYGTWQRDTIREVGIVTGCFFLMKREAWNHFGGFDPEFFMYDEEADLCMRATTEGFKPTVTPEAVIVHHGGASEKVREDKMVRLLDAETRLLRRHWSSSAFAVNSLMTSAGILLRATAMALMKVLAPNRENMWARLWSRRIEWATAAPRSSG
jgi:N-acetylglucosaminyl-diphospho-decaprenol L-rhamnosyltransferase